MDYEYFEATFTTIDRIYGSTQGKLNCTTYFIITVFSKKSVIEINMLLANLQWQ